MHIPNTALNLKNTTFPQIRLGICGEPCSGKTTSALTFPNIIVADFDGGLTRFSGENITFVPFYDEEWVCNFGFKPTKPKATANRRDAFLKFLEEDVLKMTNEQTLLLDSWTALQNAFDMQQDTDPPKITKEGKHDDYYFWQKKIEYCEKVVVRLKACKCHVVVTFHEDKVRDKNTGQLLDKIAPLMQGKFVAQLKSHFTDFFRMLAEEEKDKTGKVYKCNYFWQVMSDNNFDTKTRLAFPENTFKVEPNFKVFDQYKAK